MPVYSKVNHVHVWLIHSFCFRINITKVAKFRDKIRRKLYLTNNWSNCCEYKINKLPKRQESYLLYNIFIKINSCTETRMQTFQYKIIHRVFPFNEWLNEEYGKSMLDTVIDVNNTTKLFNETYIRHLYELSLNRKFKQHFYSLFIFSLWFKKEYIS